MWRPPTLTLRNGPQLVADPPGREPDQREGAEEAGEQVEEDRLAARRRRVAADRDADRVERRRRRRFDQALAVARARASGGRSIRPNWPASTAPAPPSATTARPTRRPLRARPAEPRPRPGAAGECESETPRGHPAQPSRDPAAASSFSSATIVFTEATVPSASSISTMWVPISRIGCSSRTLRRSMRRSRASRIASTISFGADRAEQLAVLARALVDRQHGLREQRGRLLFALGPRLLGLFGGRLAALRLLERARRSPAPPACAGSGSCAGSRGRRRPARRAGRGSRRPRAGSPAPSVTALRRRAAGRSRAPASPRPRAGAGACARGR